MHTGYVLLLPGAISAKHKLLRERVISYVVENNCRNDDLPVSLFNLKQSHRKLNRNASVNLVIPHREKRLCEPEYSFLTSFQSEAHLETVALSHLLIVSSAPR